MPGKGPTGLADEIGITRGRGAENDPRDPRLEPACEGGKIADAAAKLHRDGHRRQDRRDSLGIDRATSYGAVEVDDMQPGEALIREGARLRRRTLRVDGCGLHVAAPQPNAAATFQVDGGKQDHGRHLRKFASRPSPKAWLFSGWNWVPAMLSRATMAVRAPP